MGADLIADFSLQSAVLLADLSGLLGTLYKILMVALGLGFVIFIHELGHFLAAKACGVKCEKFYVGFDPPMKYLPSYGLTKLSLGLQLKKEEGNWEKALTNVYFVNSSRHLLPYHVSCAVSIRI